jgi:hypothetical protein
LDFLFLYLAHIAPFAQFGREIAADCHMLVEPLLQRRPSPSAFFVLERQAQADIGRKPATEVLIFTPHLSRD